MGVNKLQEATNFERRWTWTLREECLAEVARLGREESAIRLGLAPSGVESLMWRLATDWTLPTALRTAQALGLDPELIVHGLTKYKVRVGR